MSDAVLPSKVRAPASWEKMGLLVLTRAPLCNYIRKVSTCAPAVERVNCGRRADERESGVDGILALPGSGVVLKLTAFSRSRFLLAALYLRRAGAYFYMGAGGLHDVRHKKIVYPTSSPPSWLLAAAAPFHGVDKLV